MFHLEYQRVLLKLSGEALGSADYSIDPRIIRRISEEIKKAHDGGVEIAIVIGGGNIFRGKSLTIDRIDRTTGDHMGMLATVINSLAMQDQLEKIKVPTRVMSAISINAVSETYIRRRAIRHLEKRRVVIFAAGTGNPFFTTDTAASLRAAEIGAQIMIKGTKVDGVYAADPIVKPDAQFYPELSYQRALDDNLTVMDATAIVMCQENQIPFRVFNIMQRDALKKIVVGEAIGTLVS